MCNKYLVAMCVRRFLEKREGAIINLVPDFSRVTAADEKVRTVRRPYKILSRMRTLFRNFHRLDKSISIFYMRDFLYNGPIKVIMLLLLPSEKALIIPTSNAFLRSDREQRAFKTMIQSSRVTTYSQGGRKKCTL